MTDFSTLRRLEQFPAVYFFFCSPPWNNTVVKIPWSSAWNDLLPSNINTHTPIPERAGFSLIDSRLLRPWGIWGAFGGTPWHPAVPISVPSCFSSLINPLIPVQVSFSGRTGSLERDLKDLTLPRGELICCTSWGPCNTFWRHVPSSLTHLS